MEKLRGSICLKVTEPVKAEFRFVVPARYKQGTLKALDDIRALFGKNGQNWIVGAEHTKLEAGNDHPMTGETLTKAFNGYCLIGGVHEVDGRYEDLARVAISLAILEYTDKLEDLVADLEDEDSKLFDSLGDEGTITDFNDSAEWDSIKAVLKLAKQLVRSAPTA